MVFYDKPLLKFERLLETYYGFAPRGVAQFVTSMPVWAKEKLFLRQELLKELRKHGGEPKELLFSEHHLSHAASAFYPSPLKEAAILTVDGVGEWGHRPQSATAKTPVYKPCANRISHIRSACSTLPSPTMAASR